MEISIPRGRYVLAVSGGVDSMVLLDILAKKPGVDLIVAHFNHGIRADASKDQELVRSTAKRLRLKYEAGYGRLGPKTSENAARQARYAFLETARQGHGAKAIITAHHQDDLIETAFINLLRGTGRRGLVSISSNKAVIRPLLGVSKEAIVQYAKKHKLAWTDDPTNENTDYLRNYLRHKLLPGLSAAQRENLISNIDKVAKIDTEFNHQIANLSQYTKPIELIHREKFSILPYELGNELIRRWLVEAGATDFERHHIERINHSLRTARSLTTYPIKSGLQINIGQKTAHFTHTLG